MSCAYMGAQITGLALRYWGIRKQAEQSAITGVHKSKYGNPGKSIIRKDI